MHAGSRTAFARTRVDPFGNGTRYHLPDGVRVGVVGGGLAGLAASAVLAERGAEVTLFEKEPQLGGRLRAWPDQLSDGTEFQMERGFHAFFRQYYNLRRLMNRVDPGLTKLKPLDDYPLIAPSGTQRFHDLPNRPPFNVIDLVRRSDALGARELLRVGVRRALAMLSYDSKRTYAKFDTMSARGYLDSLRFPPEARQSLFDVFSHSFFNPEEDYSAAELLMNFHFYFMGNPEGLVFDVLSQPFSTGFLDPFGQYLGDRGVTLRYESEISRIEKTDRGEFFVAGKGGTEQFDNLVLALSVPGLKRVVQDSPDLRRGQFAARVGKLDVTDPFAVWRLWLDKPVNENRTSFVGTTGFGILDNISVYELFEDESRQWADRTGGSVVELHAYAVPGHLSEAEVKADLRRGMIAVYPETEAATVVDERFLVRQDCPAFRPGSHRRRPGVKTSIPGLYLAGDFVHLDFPSALMERAAASGFLSANHILNAHGVEEEAVFSVPPRGLLASPRWF